MPEQFGIPCKECCYQVEGDRPLSKERHGAKVLLVFQAPGKDEIAMRKPISSNNSRSAAARVRKSLERVGMKIKRSNFDITNAVQCYPGKNAVNRDLKPRESARKCCMEWLRRDIVNGGYCGIVVFGAFARRSIMGLELDKDDDLFLYIRHPSGGLSNIELDRALKHFFDLN